MITTEENFEKGEQLEAEMVYPKMSDVDYMKRLKDLILEELEIKKQKSMLATRESQVKADIQICFKTLNLDNYEDEFGNVASVKEMSRNSLDSKKVKEFLGESVSEYMKTSTFTTVTVKSKEERERTKRFVS